MCTRRTDSLLFRRWRHSQFRRCRQESVLQLVTLWSICNESWKRFQAKFQEGCRAESRSRCRSTGTSQCTIVAVSLRSQMLYPVELRALYLVKKSSTKDLFSLFYGDILRSSI